MRGCLSGHLVGHLVLLLKVLDLLGRHLRLVAGLATLLHLVIRGLLLL